MVESICSICSSHRTMFLLKAVTGQPKKVALCPALADAVASPEGTDYPSVLAASGKALKGKYFKDRRGTG